MSPGLARVITAEETGDASAWTIAYPPPHAAAEGVMSQGETDGQGKGNALGVLVGKRLSRGRSFEI